jgi:NAD(P)-dependent dehydrogenase (short-subunit alcohol dehydrogenase family)
LKLNEGARVILACRNLKLAEKAANLIESETKSKNVEVELLDLADLESVRNFAKRMNHRLERLDILINNAGKKVIDELVLMLYYFLYLYDRCYVSNCIYFQLITDLTQK